MDYELVRHIKNHCPNNQMRDVLIEEVSTADPAQYVRSLLKGKLNSLSVEQGRNGAVTVYADCDGLVQEFVFTPI